MIFGGDDGIRTHDPLLAGQVLSQLSYTPKFYSGFCFFVSPREPQNSFHSFRGPLVLKDPSKLNNEPKRHRSLVLTTNIVFVSVDSP